ncbi:MAG TPA: hypothetical protein PKV16_03170 [Caldisericia bacterium]|nr:hypothetical protein [Caldisericia bacterium]HPF48312.1 hypothetical protein [Caldisericia bacterium]HPI83509.1 hypothetical protein [Caldisericia bacterium]HPQ92765.1 hypothetical protein [Caldisericia bacterium]HRV74137.1 hypothetical protein [Caldisericia bacterium]
MRKLVAFVTCVFVASLLVVGCGTEEKDSDLPNEYVGEFFTIGYPADFETLGKDSGVTLTKDEQAIMIDSMEYADSAKDDIESIDGFIKEITSSVSNLKKETIKINGLTGVWIEGDNDGKSGIMLVVPLDGWFAVAINNGASDDETLELHRNIIESLVITDENNIDSTPDETTSDHIGINEDSDTTYNTESTTDEQTNDMQSTNDSAVTDPENTDFEVSELTSDGGLQLGDFYEGDYFRMRIPDNASVADYGQGDSQMIYISVGDFQIIVSALKEQQELNTDTTSTTIEIESGTLRVSNSIIDVDGHPSNFIESVAEDTMSALFTIPLQGWTITISGYAEGENEYVNSMYETIKSMVSTFVITNIDYLN